jgi:asparagine synthase (glutamine-hydrolysing)
MHVMLAWFAATPLPEPVRAAHLGRFARAAAEVVPDSWRRHEFGGPDWGVLVRHPADPGAYRWPTVATEGAVTAVSLGIPVGLDAPAGPAALARRLLGGEDVHREVVPPFALLALDRDGFALQQDWLGMARVFTGAADGVTAWCTRPGLLAAFLHGQARPDVAGWTSYTLCGHFGGDLSPLAGTRLLRPGERVTGRRRAEGGWQLDTELRYATDDVVCGGHADQGRPVGERLDRAADALTRAAASLHPLHDAEITLGLSGGKDSRLIAATLIAAGRAPRLVTNDDTRAEGEVARRLVQLVRDKRGLHLDHRSVRGAAPASVLGTGLRDRARRLADLHDHQFPSTYLARPPARAHLPETTRAASLTGAAGELAVGYWYPAADAEPYPTPEQAAMTRLLAGVPQAAAAPEALAAERERVGAVLAHARDLGLRDEHLIDYLYLVERMRRWCTSAYLTGMVTPFLAPGFVATTFALGVAQKRERLLHTALIARLVPEWAEVPFVSAATGPSTAPRIWEGDGVRTVADLLDTAHGPLTGLMRRPAVEQALRKAVRGGGPDPRVLQQFTALAVASERLEPGTTRPSTGAAYARLTAPPRPRTPAKGRLGALRWIRRTRLGDRLWVSVRRRVRGR